MRIRILVIVLILTATILITQLPSSDDFAASNPDWQGMALLSDIVPRAASRSLVEPDRLEPNATAIMILGPNLPYTREEAAAYRRFVEGGGRLILADDFGTGNTLLEGMGVGSRFSGLLMLDHLNYIKKPVFPSVTDVRLSYASEEIANLLLNHPSTLVLGDNDTYEIAGRSKERTSFLDLDRDLVRDQDEPEGPFPIVAVLRIGKGELVLVSDPSIFINDQIRTAANYKFVRLLVEGRATVLVEGNHRSMAPVQGAGSFLRGLVEAYLFGTGSPAHLFWSVLLSASVGLTAIALSIPRRPRKVARVTPRVQEIEAPERVIERHPEWDLRTLRMVHKVLTRLGKRDDQFRSREME